ncbi:MAG: DUF1127 domain-containing protein [Hyphomicrobiales bacterium]
MPASTTAIRIWCRWAKFLALIGIIEDARAQAGRALHARRDRRRLERLPDHMLKDIGISRSEILWATRYRPPDGSARDRL